jgi:3-hydroxyisobutyryl-CoA hydrolase
MRDLLALSSPTLANISSLIASHTAPCAEGPGSASNPDGASPLTPAIRKFLDQTFSLDSISAVRAALESARSNDKLGEDVQAWADEQANIMDARSPTGMAVALEGYKRALAAKRLDVVLRNGTFHLSAARGDHRACHALPAFLPYIETRLTI